MLVLGELTHPPSPPASPQSPHATYKHPAHADGASAHHPHLYQQHLLQQQQQQQQAASASEHHHYRWGSPYDGRPSAWEPDVQTTLSAGWRPAGLGPSYGYGSGSRGMGWPPGGGPGGRSGTADVDAASTGKMAEVGDAVLGSPGLHMLAHAASASEEEEEEG